VLQKATRRGNQHAHSRHLLLLFLKLALPPDEQSCTEGMMLSNRPENVEDLQGKLAGWCQNKGAETIQVRPLFAPQHFKGGDDEGKSLP
jgi:hypothetical protein